MFSPIKTMFTYFPFRAWTTVLFLLAISLYVYKQNYRKWTEHTLTGVQASSRWLLISYILLLLFFTVMGRRSLDYYRYNFDVGYSFRDAFYNGTPETAKLITVNIIIFMPIGFLGTVAAKRFGFFKALVLGVMLTFSIESLQLLLRNGTCEIDDLISNTLGTLVGTVFALLFRPVLRRIRIPSIQFHFPSLSLKPPKPAPDDPRWVAYTIELIESM